MFFLQFKDFLEEKVVLYQQAQFIESDPIQIPHQFSRKEDIEIAGFLAATIAWGNRKMIIQNAQQLMGRMGDTPYDFVMEFDKHSEKFLTGFVHRTFNGEDMIYFMYALQNIYQNYQGLEAIFTNNQTATSLQPAISTFRKIFMELNEAHRAGKHISAPHRNSAAKRINMFLRWMVRSNSTVDFGIWKNIKAAQLSCPLDVHSGRVARSLGLLTRKQDDAKALAELDNNLRSLDAEDPVKYDFALFGLGVFEKFC